MKVYPIGIIYIYYHAKSGCYSFKIGQVMATSKLWNTFVYTLVHSCALWYTLVHPSTLLYKPKYTLVNFGTLQYTLSYFGIP